MAEELKVEVSIFDIMNTESLEALAGIVATRSAKEKAARSDDH
jgi:hypothetical protein